MDSKTDGKNLKKIFMTKEKQSISHTLQKSQIPFRKGCEKFAHPALLCKNLCGCANLFRNPRTHFANPVRSPIAGAKTKGHLEAYLKPSRPCFHFTCPSSQCETLHHLATPKLPSTFSPLDAPRPPIWRGDPHHPSLLLHFGHGVD